MEEIKELIIEEVPTNKSNIFLKIMFILIAVVGIMLICLNFIPVKLDVNLPLDKVQSIAFYQDGGVSTHIYKDSNSDNFNTAINKLKNTLRTDNLAYALFTGKLFANESIEYKYQSSALSNIAMQASGERKYVCLSFSEDHQIMLNGKEYTSNELSSASKKYNKILIEINNEENLTSSTLYYINSNQSTSFRVTIQTSGEEMNEYISNFF